MSIDHPDPMAPSPAQKPARAARRLMRTALKGALGTIDRTSGYPFASLVLVATEPDGTPVFLVSALALHTQNLSSDSRASLLIDGTAQLGDPMTGARLTLTGHARPTASATAKSRYLARHPSAEAYADFPDFAMYAFDVTGGHYIGGFGRIVDLAPAELLSGAADAHELIAAERDIVSHMNNDHADAVALYATVLAGCAPGQWRMSGVDPDGADLLQCSNVARIEFPARVRTPTEARLTLIALVKQARARQDAPASQ
jgi:putative heme iron utilization protein